MIDSPILQFKNLAVGYNRGKHPVTVMCFPDIIVEKGDFIAIAGQNGIGKSTLIKTLVQLIPEISGEVVLKGRNIKEFSGVQLASHISYVSTDVVTAQQITVKELVAFGRYPYTNWFGKMGVEDMTVVDQVIEMLELKHLSAKYIDEVSDGERQRVMIARALAQKTEIVILDEPTAFLDLPHKHEIINLLGKLSKEQQKTIIFTTHDLGIAIKETDKLWLLSENGFFQGSPEDLILNGLISKTFNTSKVSFDNRKGEFSVRKTFKPYFFISGKVNAVHWTRNAIEKDGFSVIEREDPAFPVITIEQTANGYIWKLSFLSTEKEFLNILDLRKFIRNNF